MRRLTTATAAILVGLATASGARAQAPAVTPIPTPAPVPPPTYTIALRTRHACVTPHAHKLARAEGGFIDVASPAPNAVVATLTGSVVANSYLCCTGTAAETFQLVQDLEITCSDPNVRAVALSLDTALVGFVRSKGRASACMSRAEVSLTPVDVPAAPMALAYPVFTVSGTGGQSCNQHLPPLESPVMPLGRYTLVATFVLDTSASGVCDSHAVADFSPDTALPPEWLRTRDPFQGVPKKAFGFTTTISATPPTAPQATAALEGKRPALNDAKAVSTLKLTDTRIRRSSY